MTNNAKVESRSPTHDSGTRADWIKTGRRVREFAPALGSTVREVIVTLDDGKPGNIIGRKRAGVLW